MCDHERPEFGCFDCIVSARSATRTVEFRNGKRHVKVRKEVWRCPKCGKTNQYDRFVCLGKGITQTMLRLSLLPLLVCGYDRRTGDVPERWLSLIEKTRSAL